MLENSDDYFKACNSIAAMMITCDAFYDDIMVIVSSQDYQVVDELFVELGFPNRATLAEYSKNKSDSN